MKFGDFRRNFGQNLGMPIHAVELLLSAAQDAEQHVPSVVDEVNSAIFGYILTPF